VLRVVTLHRIFLPARLDSAPIHLKVNKHELVSGTAAATWRSSGMMNRTVSNHHPEFHRLIYVQTISSEDIVVPVNVIAW